MITSSLLANDTLTVILDNGMEIKTARADHPKWNDILAAYKVSPINPILENLLSMKAVVEEYSSGQLSVTSAGVTYCGLPLHTVDAQRVMAFMREGLPYFPIANYIVRKMNNPSQRAIQELYPFLEHGGMTLTPEGKIIAYKGVQNDFWSVQGNKETIVLQGKVNEQGQIWNGIGETIEVKRSCVCDDFRQPCGPGLHVGSLSYAKGHGARVILIEFDPADAVSIPLDCSCMKCRVCKYKVVGDYTGPMPNTLTTEFSSQPDDICSECGNEKVSCECEPIKHCECGSNDCADCGAGIDTEGQSQCTCGGTDCPNCGCDCEECANHTGFQPLNGPSGKTVQDGELVDIKDIKSPGVSTQEKDTCGCGLNMSKEYQLYDTTFKKMAEMAAEQWGKTPIDSTTMNELGADSLDAVEFAMALEEEFGIQIPDEDTEKFVATSTFSELVNYIANIANDRDFGIAFMNGQNDGSVDRLKWDTAIYLSGDDLGADTPLHAQYIKGYVKGYENPLSI